ncbi:MAG TPA: type I methionyl aminopeptidase [Bacteroidota bacterium]|nr:type I methionyl aminopeptidase [Bacteroidota bacterium]
MVTIKTEKEIALIRESSQIVADVLRLLEKQIYPGVATKDLDSLAEDFIRSSGGAPAFKGYGSDRNNLFPASICVSIDNEVVHGIPGNRVLKEGEIVSLDVGVVKEGFFGDGAWTFPVGKVSEGKARLMRITQESLDKGVEQAVEGNYLHDISHAVQHHVEAAGFSVVRDLVGHGIGTDLHEDPPVPNYGKAKTGLKLKEGMTLAIEPMVNFGAYDVRTGRDGWTIVTADNTPSAHFEHTVVVRKNRAEILTQ